MTKRKDTDYLYASSRIRALEKTLLTKERIDRMLEARTLEDSLKVLQEECEYGLAHNYAPNQYEELLSDEHQKNISLLNSIDEELSPFFLYRYDYLNIKILLKAEFLGLDEVLLSPLGSIPVDKLKTVIRERTFAEMTPLMKQATADVIETFGRNRDPQIIDLLLDKACYEDMKVKAKELDNKFIDDYLKWEIDSANIKAFVRIKRQGGVGNLFRQAFISGGRLEIDFYLNLFGDELSALQETLNYTVYGEMIVEAIPAISKGDLGNFEKILEDYSLRQLKKAKFVPFGQEPLVAYMAAKENDLKTARIILAGKAAGIANQRIAEKVRETYV